MDKKNKIVTIGSLVLLITLVIFVVVISYQSTRPKKTASRASEMNELTPFTTVAPPSEIPLPSGAELVSAVSLNAGRDRTFVWHAGADPISVFDTAKNNLLTAGWESISATDAGSLQFVFVKDSRTITLSVTADQTIGKTVIAAKLTDTNEQ